MRINLKQSQIMLSEVNFLVYIVNTIGIKPQNSNVNDVVNFRTKSCTTNTNYVFRNNSFFQKPNFKICAATFTVISFIKNGVSSVWNKYCDELFSKIKNNLQYPEMLMHPKFDHPFITQCNASNKTIKFS